MFNDATLLGGRRRGVVKEQEALSRSPARSTLKTEDGPCAGANGDYCLHKPSKTRPDGGGGMITYAVDVVVVEKNVEDECLEWQRGRRKRDLPLCWNR